MWDIPQAPRSRRARTSGRTPARTYSMNALIGFELMGLARRNDTIVILNGQGADETLGGYSSHFPAYWTSLVVSGRPDRAWREI